MIGSRLTFRYRDGWTRRYVTLLEVQANGNFLCRDERLRAAGAQSKDAFRCFKPEFICEMRVVRISRMRRRPSDA